MPNVSEYIERLDGRVDIELDDGTNKTLEPVMWDGDKFVNRTNVQADALDFSSVETTGLLVPAKKFEKDVLIGQTVFSKRSFGDLFDYVVKDSVSFSSTAASVTGVSTSWQTIGEINLPADILVRSVSSVINFAVSSTVSLDSVQLAISIQGKNGTRAQTQYYTVKDFGSTTSKTGALSIGVQPLNSSLLQLSQVSAPTAPTSYPVNSVQQVLSGNFLSGVKIKLLVKFGSVNVANIVSLSEGKITFTPRELDNSDLSFNSKIPFRAPFPDNDVWKSRLPSYTVAHAPVIACNPGTTGDTSTGSINAQGTSGSDILTVYSTTGIEVGMFPVAGVQGKVQGSSAFDTMRPHFPNSVDTYNYFGSGTTVIAIVNSTQVQLSQPVKTTFTLRGQIWSGGEAMNCIGFYKAPETACIRSGQGSNTLTISPFTGVQKTSTAATAARSMVVVARIGKNDPVKSWRISSVNANNAWLHDYSSSNVNASLESVDNATFNIKTPTWLTQTYLENGAQNPDKNLVMVTECGRFAIEMIGVNLNVTPATATRAIVVDLTRQSYPTLDQYDIGTLSNGTRAYGGPLIGGMIRKWELDQCYDSGNMQADIARAMNAINHPVAILMGSGQGKSNNYCPDPLVQGTKVLYKSYRSTNKIHSPTIVAGGSGYKVGDVLYVVGGTYTTQMSCVVLTVSSGAVTSVQVVKTGQYKTLPSDVANLATTTTGSGTGCVLNTLNLPQAPDQTSSAIAFPDIASLGQVCQYPAAIADNGYATNYAGVVPMGAVFTISKSLDLASIWTTRRTSSPTALSSSFELLAVLAAIQRHGAIVIDVSGSFQQMLVVDDAIAYSSNYANLHGDTGSSTYPNLELIKRHLIYVENYSTLVRDSSLSNQENKLLTLS